MRNLNPAAPVQDEEEDEEEIYLQQLEGFSNLDHTTCEFITQNVKERHCMIAPIIKPSIFNPRYKKLTLFFAEVSMLMAIITVGITWNGKIVISFDPNVPSEEVGTLIGFAMAAGLISSGICYLIASMMRTSVEQRRKIYNVVKSGKELLILKEW